MSTETERDLFQRVESEIETLKMMADACEDIEDAGIAEIYMSQISMLRELMQAAKASEAGSGEAMVTGGSTTMLAALANNKAAWQAEAEPQVVGRIHRDVLGYEGDPVPRLNSEGRKLPDGAPLYTTAPLQQAEAEPVAWMTEITAYDPPARCTHGTVESAQNYQKGAGGPERCRIVPVYTTPPAPAPVVPGKTWPENAPGHIQDDVDMAEAWADGWNDCRDAMLSASPQQERTCETKQAVERLAMDNITVRRCVDMHRYHGAPWTECMEIAVAALAESESYLKEKVIQAAMNQPAHTIVGKIVEGSRE